MSAARQSFRTGTGPRPLPVPASALQRDLLLDTLVRPGAGVHTGQLLVRWYGPLDADRFTAAWQALHDSDAALRTALADPAGGLPAMAVHPRVEPRITHADPDGADWHTLVQAERLREFDLRRPGQLRILLLEGTAQPGATRILFTYHHAFLDGRSVRGLLRAFLRAYAADGRPLGGERRPDVRDHAHWLARQDTFAAREFWAHAAPPPGAATLPALRSALAGEPDRAGHGWSRERLTRSEAERLRAWAAGRGRASRRPCTRCGRCCCTGPPSTAGTRTRCPSRSPRPSPAGASASPAPSCSPERCAARSRCRCACAPRRRWRCCWRSSAGRRWTGRRTNGCPRARSRSGRAGTTARRPRRRRRPSSPSSSSNRATGPTPPSTPSRTNSPPRACGWTRPR
ncbi:condensation domain-containing protein [Streptomyces nojiriensis]